jgi:hypothetical protein
LVSRFFMQWTDHVVQGSVVALVAIYLFTRFLTTPKNIPPGPFPWPLIGSLHLIGPYPQRALWKLAQQYGPLISVWFGQRLIIVATSPETAMEFVKTQDANFCSRPKQQATTILLPHGERAHELINLLKVNAL